MSGADFSAPATGGAQRALPSQDFDLNLAPIIDCFTVLIAFVMISTAFASVGILDASIAAGGKTPIEAAAPEVRLRVDLEASGGIALQMSGKDTRQLSIPPLPTGKRDTDAFAQGLVELKAKWPSLVKARLAADNNVGYQDVVSAIETLRKVIPGVALDGF